MLLFFAGFLVGGFLGIIIMALLIGAGEHETSEVRTVKAPLFRSTTTN